MLNIDNKEEYLRYSANSKESSNSRYHAAIYVIETSIKENNSSSVEVIKRIGNCLSELEKLPMDIEFRKNDLFLLIKTVEWSLVNQTSLGAAKILKRSTGIGVVDDEFLNLNAEQKKLLCKKWSDAIEKL
ncbi:MAG: hypothetical protein V4727_07960 [Verrucomicrobiota bacterium]